MLPHRLTQGRLPIPCGIALMEANCCHDGAADGDRQTGADWADVGLSTLMWVTECCGVAAELRVLWYWWQLRQHKSQVNGFFTNGGVGTMGVYWVYSFQTVPKQRWVWIDWYSVGIQGLSL